MTIKELYEQACALGIENINASIYNEEVCKYYEVAGITLDTYDDGFKTVHIHSNPFFGIHDEPTADDVYEYQCFKNYMASGIAP